MKKNLVFGLVLVAIGISSNGQIKLPALISDSMILQRNQRVNIWGWSLKGEPVNICFNQKKYSAVPDKDKKWTLTLPETKASDKTYTLKITTAYDSVEVKEIVVKKPQLKDILKRESDEVIELIKKLGDLHSAGILTDDEFTSKKKELLSKI